MATNNYFGFTHGGTQYTAPGAAAAAYPTAQTGYGVAQTGTASSYGGGGGGGGGAQRTGYDQAYQAANTQGNYSNAGGGNVGGTAAAAAVAATYDYGYGRPAQSYDSSKTFYQQSSAYGSKTKTRGYQTAQYVAAPTRNPIATATAANKSATANAAAAAAIAASTYASQTYTNSPAATQQQQPPSIPAVTVNSAHAAASTAGNSYASYDAALYSAAAMYAAGQTGTPASSGHAGNWQTSTGGAPTGGAQASGGSNYNHNNNRKHGGGQHGNGKPRMKPQPKPQQLHYCEVCKISCAGPQTYREHLEGQKHKKREASLKLAATAATATQNNRGNNLHCELCDVTCTGNDAYAAHVRGSKHQKVLKLHQKLGKPIPATDPQTTKKQTAKIHFVQQTGTELSMPGYVPAAAAAAAVAAAVVAPVPPVVVGVVQPVVVATPVNPASVEASHDVEDCSMDDIKPVGLEYIEEQRDEEGKTLSFNCKLCECKFNDPNAKEMHMKGRRHRLQYKKKVQPDLVVDFKPNPRQRRMAEAKAQRAVMQAEYWNQKLRHLGGPGGGPSGGGGTGGGEDGEEDAMYWDERRRFEEEFDYMGGGWQRGGFPGGLRGAAHMRPPPFFGMVPGRRPESSDDRHVVARHAEIYPKEEELQTIQRIVSHTERALKFVSDALVDKPADAGGVNGKEGGASGDGGAVAAERDAAAVAASKAKEDGRDNQMFSFQKDAELGVVRVLKGVMRVGLLAKGLLLHGDNVVQLVVLCANKPNLALLKRVAAELPIQLKLVSEDHQYTITLSPEDGEVIVTDGTITVRVALTSPLVRDPSQDATTNTSALAATAQAVVLGDDDLLPRQPCLQALAALRHAKWFQARATGLQSCVMIMRIMRDLCARTPTWTPLSQWALELLIEKIISSAGLPLSPGDCMRRVMEGISTGLLINGPGVLDPCEKDPHDALAGLSKQQREDLTVSAQTFLRLIAFRQIHKVLGMDALPAPKFQQRQWRFTRKRRRSGADGADAEADGKLQKKDANDASESKADAVAK